MKSKRFKICFETGTDEIVHAFAEKEAVICAMANRIVKGRPYNDIGIVIDMDAYTETYYPKDTCPICGHTVFVGHFIPK